MKYLETIEACRLIMKSATVDRDVDALIRTDHDMERMLRFTVSVCDEIRHSLHTEYLTQWYNLPMTDPLFNETVDVINYAVSMKATCELMLAERH